ncbi:MAG: hypothetical protein ACOX87_14540 [Chloroflexota bacterium]|jgi:hypothetical protein
MFRSIRLLARYLWASPNTLLGIAAAIASFSIPRRAGSILTCHSNRGFAHWFLTRRGYCAVTLGHVVLMTSQAKPDVLGHEMVHVRQEERWGPFYLPVYCLSMLITRLHGKDPYWDNPFEIEARLLDRPSTPPDCVA